MVWRFINSIRQELLDKIKPRTNIPFLLCAEVAELVDALGSGSSEGFLVGVQVSPSAPHKQTIYIHTINALLRQGFFCSVLKKIVN